MTNWTRFTIGLVAAFIAGWVSHGPLGRGEAFVDRLEREARSVVTAAELPSVRVRFDRDRLTRVALLSGQADDFQREGQGLYPGINDRIRAIPGVAAIRWESER